jgi:hypothetical protein
LGLTNIEIVAAEVAMRKIVVHELDGNCDEENVTTYRPQNIIKTISLARNEEFFVENK